MFSHVLRILRHHPTLWIPAGLSLTLAMTAATMGFALWRAIIQAPLALPEPDRLVAVSRAALNPTLSPAEYQRLRDRVRSFESIAGRRRLPVAMDLGWDDGRRPVQVLPVTPSYFRVLGSSPWLGADFPNAESGLNDNAPIPIILSRRLWQSRFEASPDVIGTQVRIRSAVCEVIGVSADVFTLLDSQVDVWMAQGFGLDSLAPPTRGVLVAVGRLGTTVNVAQAQTELAAIWEEEGSVGSRRALVRTESLKSAVLGGLFSGDSVIAKLQLLFALFLILFVAGSANCLLLLYLRGTHCGREHAIRRALGQTRLRHLLDSATESLVLTLIGVIAGLVLSSTIFRFLGSVGSRPLPLIDRTQVQLAEALFAGGLAILLGFLLGLGNALLTLRLRDDAAALQAGQRLSTPFFKRPLAALNSIQVAASTILAICTAVLLQYVLSNLWGPTGVRSDGVLKADLRLPNRPYFEKVEGNVEYPHYDELIRPEFWTFYDEALRRLSHTPGIQEVAFCGDLQWEDPRYFVLAGQEGLDFQLLPKDQRAVYRPMSPGFFEVLRIPIIQGRAFGKKDGRYAEPVAIIDENLARRWWPGKNPIGDYVTLLDDAPSGVRRRIVGVAAKSRVKPEQSIREPTVYLPYLQIPGDRPTLLGIPRRLMNILWRQDASASPPLLEIIRDLDQDVVLVKAQPLDEYLDSPFLNQQFYVYLMSGLTAAALILSLLGISGATLYLMQARRAEMGIRVALGAPPWSALIATLQEQGMVVLTGLGIGALGAVLLSDSLRAILGGMDSDTTVVYAVVLGVLGAMGLAAAGLSAGKSLRLDPSEMLRHRDG